MSNTIATMFGTHLFDLAGIAAIAVDETRPEHAKVLADLLAEEDATLVAYSETPRDLDEEYRANRAERHRFEW